MVLNCGIITFGDVLAVSLWGRQGVWRVYLFVSDDIRVPISIVGAGFGHAGVGSYKSALGELAL